MIEIYRSQVCIKSAEAQSDISSIKICEGHNGGEQIEVHNEADISSDGGQPENENQRAILYDGQQQSQSVEEAIEDDHQLDHCNGQKYVQELWEKVKANWDIELDEENMPDTTRNELRRESFLCKIKTWASNHSITHMAIGDLMKVLNEENPDINLPIDGRTVMETPRQIKITEDATLGGKYWHYGLQAALVNALTSETIESNTTIHLTINIDGLPLYNSSHIEFWPILVKIFEYDHIPPLIIGIYCGRGKYTT